MANPIEFSIGWLVGGPAAAPAVSAPITTPCIGICDLDDAGLCIGCRRNGDEIARWSSMTESQRIRLMDEVLPARPPAAL